MILTAELAQYIVNYTSDILDYAVNFMDSDAVIIASNDESRIGEVHVGAKKVLQSGNPYIIDKEEAANYPNVVPGISLPVKFRNNVIGVIGVGAGELSDTIGKMVQRTTELLVEQFYLKENMAAQKQVHNEFLTHLLSEPWEDNESYFNYQLRLHGYNIDQSYLVVIAELSGSAFENDYLSRFDTEVVRYEKSITGLLENIEYALNLHSNTVYIPSSIIFLIPYSPGTGRNAASFQKKFIERLDKVLKEQIKGDYRIGCGGFAENMTQVHYCYERAGAALKVSHILKEQTKTINFTDVYFENMLLNIRPDQQEKYWKTVIGKLVNEDEEGGTWLETLDVFFKNDRHISSTAEELYIHRNTLMFRLNRIGEITGFYPQHLTGALNLYTALVFYKQFLKR